MSSAALNEAELRAIEAEHAEGLTSQQLVDVFQRHGVNFSEANLRRYVQLELVPRSRRVGTKGKHSGSRGVYPVRAVRRINTIKRLMGERYTLEEIQDKFLTFKDSIETLDEALADLLALFETRLESQPPTAQRQRLADELTSLKGSAGALLKAVHRFEKLIVSAGGARRPRGGGAASPTELL
ncbi:MAG: MerR family transcriptional regulator [Myxococcales bacterium FL481]|nr:MAG: MerR family transcriptional regulator [Myxococcales bacterium FL481]